jgi:hypothetical protein
MADNNAPFPCGKTPSVRLTGTDSNTLYLIGRCREAARRAGVPRGEIETFSRDATSGDYDHALAVMQSYFDVS